MLLIVLGLMIQGLALGMICVPTFVDSMRAALWAYPKQDPPSDEFIYLFRFIYFFFSSESGFPNDIHTYGLLSGIWSSSFALGAFLGPSIAGVLYDLVGFEKGTYFEISIHLALVSGNVFAFAFMLYASQKKKKNYEICVHYGKNVRMRPK